MKSLKRVAMLASVLGAWTVSGAEIALRVEHDRFGYAFSVDPIHVRVHISALDVTEKIYVRASAHDHVQYTLYAADREVLGTQPEAIPNPSATRSEVPSEMARGVSQNLWTFSGNVKFAPLPPGEYTLEAKYGDISDEIKFSVWKGDENETVRAARLGREADRAETWTTFRALQLERLEIQPTNFGILWELAQHAEASAPLDETKRYYAQALEVARSNFESRHAFDTEQGRQEFMNLERMIAEIDSLLPDFYLNRSELAIKKPAPGNPESVKLVERKTGRVVKSASGRLQDVAP